MKRLTCALICLHATCAAASDLRAIARYYETVLQTPGDRPLPSSIWADSEAELTLLALTQEEARSLSPLVLQCFRSKWADVRKEAIMLVLMLSRRADGARLIAPYTDALILVLQQPDAELRNEAVLALTRQPLPAKARSYLVADLDDGRASAFELASAARALLSGEPPVDTPLLNKILETAQRRKIASLSEAVLERLGALRIANNGAIAFIRESLSTPEPPVRLAALAAIEKMDREVRNQFSGDLINIRAGAPESQVRASAARILAK